MTINILCFGDSITYGAWDLDGGWVARVRQRIDKICLESDSPKFYQTYNLGISADTTERLLGRFSSELTAYTKDPADNYIIVSIGTNDSIRNTTDKSLWVNLPQFEQNIATLISQAQAAGTSIIFLGNLPVDDDKTHPYRYDDSIESSNDDIKAYELATQRICHQKAVGFIPVFENALKTSYKSMLAGDGVHPNAKGHAYLADKVWDHFSTQPWLRL